MELPVCPEGREDCLFEPVGAAWKTDVYYQPRYNRKGENINPDRNVTSGEVACVKCGALWKYTQCGLDPRVYQRRSGSLFGPKDSRLSIESDEEITLYED